MPAIVGDSRCRARVQDVHPALRSWTEADSCHASFHQGSVQAIEGLLKVEEDHDTGLLSLLHVADLFKMGEHVVASPALEKEACLCGVHNMFQHWPVSAGKRV